MLDALDKTLKSLLENNIKEVPSTKKLKVMVAFVPPSLEAIKSIPESNTNAIINLFLYDVQENLELRTSKWLVERQSNGKATKKRPPGRVDCSYLITVWIPGSVLTEIIEQEHELLGEVMKVLLRNRQLPETLLSNDLEGQEIPLRLISLRPSKIQSPGEFWQAMGGKDGTRPKVVLHCTVTISVPMDEADEADKAVEGIGLAGVYLPKDGNGE